MNAANPITGNKKAPRFLSAPVASPAAFGRAFFTVAVVIAATAGIWSVKATIYGPSPAFMGAYGAALTIAEAFTAILLSSRAIREHDGRLAFLAGAYVFAALLVAGNIVTLPTAAGTLFNFETAPWMWTFWHVGWGVFLLNFAWRRAFGVPLGVILVAVGATACCMWTAIYAVNVLPPLLSSDGIWLPLYQTIFALIAVCYAASIAGFVIHRNSLSDLELWVGVATAVAICEVALTATSLARFSLGYYAGRALSVVSSLMVFVSIAVDYINSPHNIAALENRVQKALALSNADRDIAQKLQNAFLPPLLPIFENIRFDAVCRPVVAPSLVGGDWYDAFPVAGGRVALSIGDVSGHGLEAASTMVRIREAIRSAALSTDALPAIVLAAANRTLVATEIDHYATAIFAVFDPATGLLEYSCAGHAAPILRRGEHSTLLKGGGVILGIDAAADFATLTFQLASEDTIAFYTDGLVENTRNMLQGELLLLQALASSASATDIVNLLLTSGQSDDVALVMVTISNVQPLPRAAGQGDRLLALQLRNVAWTSPALMDK